MRWGLVSVSWWPWDGSGNHKVPARTVEGENQGCVVIIYGYFHCLNLPPPTIKPLSGDNKGFIGHQYLHPKHKAQSYCRFISHLQRNR